MQSPIVLPDVVLTSIRNHVNQIATTFAESYLAASEDEDTLTGDFLGRLRATQVISIDNPEIGGKWAWGIQYTKLRGRGQNAPENTVGADGIFELEVNRNGRIERKAALFQSKKHGSNEGLLSQVSKLLTWREAAFILKYSPDECSGLSLDEALTNLQGKEHNNGLPFSTFFVDRFLKCEIGDQHLHYDARNKRLFWMDMKSQEVYTQFPLAHRLRTKVSRKASSDYLRARSVLAKDVHKHRMKAEPEDILSLSGDYSNKDLKQAQKVLSHIYHDDKQPNLLDELSRSQMRRMMQEINRAYSVLRR